MASPELLHHTENFTPTWYGKPHEQYQHFGCPNVPSNLTKRDWFSRTQQRPHILRLNSTGESADSSPEPEESLGSNQNRRPNNWDTSKRRFRGSNSSVQQEVAAKARRTTNLFQGDNSFHSKESLGPVELDLLASKFNSCSTNQLNHCQDSNFRTSETNYHENMSQCYSSYNQDNGPRPLTVPTCDPYQPQNMMPIPNSGHLGTPSESQQQAHHNDAAISSFMNMSVFRPNFIHQPFQKWHQRITFPQRPPVVPAPMVGFNNSPFFQMPLHGPAPPPNFNFYPHRAHFVPFRFNQQVPQVHVKEQKYHPSANITYRKKNPNKETNHPRMFTKILQRPPQKDTSEKKCNAARNSVETSRHSVANHVVESSTDHTLVKSSDVTVRDNRKSSGVKSKCSSANAIAHMKNNKKWNKSNAAGIPNSIKSKQGLGKLEISDRAKQRHSSIEFLLSSLKSGDRLSDSDFVDCDWDTLDNSDDHTWDEYFLSNDPYNPLSGWRCQKGSPEVEETEGGGNKVCSSSSQWCHRSQDFDSGTESGSEGESNSDSEGDVEGKVEPTSVSEQRRSEVVSSSTETKDEADSCKTSTEQSIQELKNKVDESDTAKRQKCLHPSISYVLGGFDAAYDEDSDDESDDWDSFDDSDDERTTGDLSSSLKSNLFQFSNNRFPPLAYFRRDPLTAPEVKSSPSVPCGPIFKPKARTVLISQRIICQVSDRPVSMIVPLEPNGRMSQNSMPTIQVSGQSSPKVRFPTSCLKSISGSSIGIKNCKKVHFNNKATLIICPEPSHLIDEIKNTRRGPWLDYARDRCRFQHRIQHLERVIGPCLSAEHRKKILERIQEPQTTL